MTPAERARLTSALRQHVTKIAHRPLRGARPPAPSLRRETLSGSRGFWVFVVPGVIHNHQPRFNEGPAMWHLEGATLPLARPL
jgi:hypothetical protein